MSNYWHMMEQVTLSDRKKEEIMDMLENKGTQKRRMPRAGKIVLAAALAVGCVLSIAAGLPAQVYNFMSGGMVSIEGGKTENITASVKWEPIDEDEQNAPIVLEDGKLWFVNGEKRTDLTGLIDENTPYIYEHTDPATGNKGYVIVGGGADNYGWAEFFLTEGGAASMTGDNYADSYLTIEGVRQPSYELSEELVEKLNNDPSYALETVNHPWFQAALDQLEMDF